MDSLTHFTPRTSADRQDHVLRTIGGCRIYAAHRLAAEERYLTAAAANERARLLREAGVPSVGITEAVTSVGAIVGSVLIRIGEQLRGQPSGNAATRAEHGA